MMIKIGKEEFRTKKQATEYIRGLVNAEEINTPFKSDFFCDLIKLHQESEKKIGCGVDSFKIVFHKKWKNRGVILIRKDGSETDFSWTACLTPRNDKSNALAAARNEIVDQINSFRTLQFKKINTCPVTGEDLHKNCHVDHHPISFHTLFNDWMSSKGINYHDIKVNKTKDGCIETFMVDALQRESWQLYHLTNAQLRLISKRANLEKT